MRFMSQETIWERKFFLLFPSPDRLIAFGKQELEHDFHPLCFCIAPYHFSIVYSMVMYFPISIPCSSYKIIWISELCACRQVWFVITSIPFRKCLAILALMGMSTVVHSLSEDTMFLLRSLDFWGKGNYNLKSFYWQGNLKSSWTSKCLADSFHPK